MNTFDFIMEHKLVAISRGVYGTALLEAARSILAGGFRLLEITFDQADPGGISKTATSISMVKKELGEQICVGAGTVMTPDQARAARDAGADFALAPNVDLEVIRTLKKLGMLAVPGAMTPSEIAAAWNEGAEIVKVFPASVLGPAFVRAVRGPVNNIPLMAVGGVSTDNVRAFLDAGCCSAGIGSNIISRKRADAGDFEGMKNTAAAFVAAAFRKA